MLNLIPGKDLVGINTVPMPKEKRVDALGTVIGELVNLTLSQKSDGLAAPQVGVNLKVFVARFQDAPGKIAVIFNPQYLPSGKSKRKKKNRETSLSFPLQAWDVPRYRRIRVRYENHLGQTIERRMKGKDAFLFQQLTDILNGVPICVSGGK